MAASDHDVFLCHAGEDRARFARPLQRALEVQGLKVWGGRAIALGEDMGARIDEGLRRSRFGVVILSQRLFVHRPKLGEVLLGYWPGAQVGALIHQELIAQRVRLLPVRCDLTAAELAARSPLLAGRVSVAWELGLEAVASRIAAAVRAEEGAQPAVGSPVYNLPVRRAQRLYGRRTELEQLEELLVPDAGEPAAACGAVSLTGMVGVGKTELALHLVARLAARDRFPGGIFWLDAAQPDLTPMWGGPIARELALRGGTMEERAASALRFVGRGAPVLLVLDQVERWTRAAAPHPLPRGPHVARLVTTSNAFLANDFVDYKIDCLPRASARALLCAIADRELGDGLEELLEYLGGHTLAVELAGAYLRELVTVTPAGYLARLRAGEPVEGEVCARVAYEGTVAQAFEAAWARLGREAQRALQIAACFDSSEASLAWLRSCGVAEEALRGLRRFHLMAVSGGRWHIHRLVRDHVQRRGDEGALASAEAAFVAGIAAAIETIAHTAGHQAYLAGRAHLERALELAEGVWADAPRRRSALADRVGTTAHAAGDHLRARRLLERALELELGALDEQHPDVATRRSNLALVLKDLGELARAQQLLEDALLADLAVFGNAHPRVALRRSNLAIVLQARGELRWARHLLERALAASAAAVGERHAITATSRSNLAGVLLELGELPRARRLLEEALASELTAPEEDPCSLAACHNNLALVLEALGERRRARQLLEDALAASAARLGERHPSVAELRLNLASLHEARGELAQARRLYERTLAGEEHLAGTGGSSAAYVRARLARVAARLGKRALARRAIVEALEAVRHELPGSRHRAAIKAIAREILKEEATSPRTCPRGTRRSGRRRRRRRR